MHVDFDETGDTNVQLMHDQNGLLLTPTARLARAHLQQHARQQVTAGISVWRRPQLLPMATWLQQLQQQAVLLGCVERVLITPEQARWLWQQVIDQDVFVGEPKVAELAEHAWQQVHEYCLADPEQWPRLELSDDAHAFRQWVWRFRQRCTQHNVIDPATLNATLPQFIAAGKLQLAQRIELLGFELPLTPLQQALLAAAEAAGSEIIAEPSIQLSGAADQAPPAAHADDADVDTAATMAALRQAGEQLQVQRFVDVDAELQAAANWARQQLETNPAQSIAVVVSDLHARIDAAEQVFSQVFAAPAFALQESALQRDQPSCWHISLGKRLQQWPLVSDALLLLRLDPSRIDQPRIGRVLRSPFVRGWSREAAQRSACFAALQRDAAYEVSARAWQQSAHDHGATCLHDGLQQWQQLYQQQPARALPSAWAGAFHGLLDAFGFAQGQQLSRKLDSREYQLLQRWHMLLEQFAALDVVVRRPLTRSAALALLEDCAGRHTFRERNPGCPIEVLGVAEALGSRFDALWITSLDADSWPPPVRREALLPAPVQKVIPGANSAGCLHQAALQLQGLLRCGDEVRGSLANDGEAEQMAVTALLGAVSVQDVPARVATADVVLELLADDIVAPALSVDVGNARSAGGTGIIRDQSACGFRAFAGHRLRARELRPPRPGLNAMERGNLLHQALEWFWRDLPDQAALQALDSTALTVRIERASRHALQQLLQAKPLLLSPGGQALEKKCLQRALQNWLRLELERPAFAIAALEQFVAIELAGLHLRGKMDRVDSTDNGSLLIDYKSGRVNKSDWFPEPRIADPQLPLYALAMQPPPQAIAFASLAPDQMRFDGLAAVDCAIEGISTLGSKRSKFKHYSEWSQLLQDWELHLQALAADFRAGKAAVDPRQPEVCKYCHLHALCRIHERTMLINDEVGAEP